MVWKTEGMAGKYGMFTEAVDIQAKVIVYLLSLASLKIND